MESNVTSGVITLLDKKTADLLATGECYLDNAIDSKKLEENTGYCLRAIAYFLLVLVIVTVKRKF